MTAYVQNIYIEQGASFPLGFVLHEPTLDGDGNVVLDGDGNPVPGTPISLAGCVARMQIRPKISGGQIFVHASSLSLDDDPLGGQRITLEAGSATGRVDIVLTDQDTDKVLKDGFYDLELEHPADDGALRPFVERILQGTVTVSLNVTRGETSDDGNADGTGGAG